MPASRRARENAEKIDRTKVYEMNEVFEALKGCRKAKFDETVEVVVRLGVDPKKSDQMVGCPQDPEWHAEGDVATACKEAGAMEVGSDELAAKIEKGWTDFDVVIAHPSMMRVVGKLGRVLGPQGKMPSPKSGTVTPNAAQAVSDFCAGKVEFRVDSGSNLHVPVGKASFSSEQLADNTRAFLDYVMSLRPATAKGAYIRNVSVSTTMGPGLKVEYAD